MSPAPWHSPGGILAYNVQVATGTNETADHSLANVSIPASGWAVASFFADAYRFEAWGTSDNAASATLNFWLKIGSTKVATASVAFPASAGTAKRWQVMGVIICRSVGSGGTAMAQMWGVHESLAAPSLISGNLIASPAVATLNTTVAENLALGMNWSAASASNNSRCDVTWCERIANANQ